MNWTEWWLGLNKMNWLGPLPRSPRMGTGGLLDVIFICMGIGPCGLVLPPPQEWITFPPLVTAVLITPKGAELPGSCHIWVFGTLVYFLKKSQKKQNLCLGTWQDALVKLTCHPRPWHTSKSIDKWHLHTETMPVDLEGGVSSLVSKGRNGRAASRL